MGRPLALNPGANQYTGPACGAKKCFIAAAAAGDITTTINKGRRAGPMSSLLLLDVYGSMILQINSVHIERESMFPKPSRWRDGAQSLGMEH